MSSHQQVEQLGDSDFIHVLEAMLFFLDQEQGDVELLKQGLKHANAEVRWRCAILLAQLQAPVEHQLVELLQDSSWEVRQAGAWGLGLLKSEVGAQALLEAFLHSEDEQIPYAATRALLTLSPENVLPMLETCAQKSLGEAERTDTRFRLSRSAIASYQ